MRSGLRGVLSGALALIALEVLVSSGYKRVQGLFGLPARWAKRFLDPRIPAIPDLRERDGARGNIRAPTGGGGGGGGGSPLATGFNGRTGASSSAGAGGGGGGGTTRYPSPFERPAGLSGGNTGGD